MYFHLVCMQVVAEEGFTGLYRGLAANMLKSPLNVGISKQLMWCFMCEQGFGEFIAGFIVGPTTCL